MWSDLEEQFTTKSTEDTKKEYDLTLCAFCAFCGEFSSFI
jgi:hypothetical protein